MAMNAVETLLSSAADVVEQGLQVEATRQEAHALLQNDQTPTCTRLIAGMPGVVCTVTLAKS